MAVTTTIDLADRLRAAALGGAAPDPAQHRALLREALAEIHRGRAERARLARQGEEALVAYARLLAAEDYTSDPEWWRLVAKEAARAVAGPPAPPDLPW